MSVTVIIFLLELQLFKGIHFLQIRSYKCELNNIEWPATQHSSKCQLPNRQEAQTTNDLLYKITYVSQKKALSQHKAEEWDLWCSKSTDLVLSLFIRVQTQPTSAIIFVAPLAILDSYLQGCCYLCLLDTVNVVHHFLASVLILRNQQKLYCLCCRMGWGRGYGRNSCPTPTPNKRLPLTIQPVGFPMWILEIFTSLNPVKAKTHAKKMRMRRTVNSFCICFLSRVAWGLAISLMSVLISKSQVQDAAFNWFRWSSLIEPVPECFLSSVLGDMFSKPGWIQLEQERPVDQGWVGDGQGDREYAPLKHLVYGYEKLQRCKLVLRNDIVR